MEIINRARWGARYANGFGTRRLPATQSWLHHSVTIAPDLVPPFDDDYAAIRALEDIGQRRFGGGISYTRLITPAGLIFEGHSIDRVGSHTADRNTVAVGYCLVGNYEVQRPTVAQVRALAWCLQHDHQHGWIDTPRLDGGHRDLKSTACPGGYAYEAIPSVNQLAAGGPIEEEDVKPFQDLILAREAKDKPGSSWPKVFAGNGIVRRHVKNEVDLKNLQYRIQLAGGNSEVQEGWAPGSLPGVLGVELKDAS
jgi:hypothetical protein